VGDIEARIGIEPCRLILRPYGGSSWALETGTLRPWRGLPGAVKAHYGGSFCALQAHLRAVEAHPGAVEFHPGVVDAHHGTVKGPLDKRD
jgi:hypothetical protein